MTDRLGREFLYLSQADVAGLGLSMADIITALEAMFREKAAGRVEMPPKPGVHTRPDAFLHAMPAYIPSQNAVGMKWVGGYPENHRRNLPYITGLLLLNDVETGIPIAAMDCTWITAKRTGAATAVAARCLARPESRTVGILGCGVQGRSNLEALKVIFQLGTVRAFDVDRATRESYARDMSTQCGLDVIPVTEPKEAVVGCDIVVTAGPILRQPHATIQRGWFAEGAFASLVDFDSYWHPDALRQVDKFCTDDVPQLEHYRHIGYFQHIPPIHADLGELVSGRRPGRETPRERTMACNLGLALDDIATAPLVYERALKAGVGTWLPL
ncbi:MAG: ornithine cyclodeaminase family protein [Acidobacteria bacterium]|nr:ornithine cyclodeaminase family protein [Acidobacteriota bacterium]